MPNTAKKAILQAKIEGVLTDLMPKTTAEHVMYDETTTVAAKLAAILADVAALPTTTTVNSAISALRTELMGEGVPEAYDTFKELADYISTHQEAADALTAAVGNKADKTTVEALQATINGLGALANKSTVEEGDLSAALKVKRRFRGQPRPFQQSRSGRDHRRKGDGVGRQGHPVCGSHRPG